MTVTPPGITIGLVNIGNGLLIVMPGCAFVMRTSRATPMPCCEAMFLSSARPRQWRIRNDPVKHAPLPTDEGRMLTIPPPMSNAERQRLFRERNPGYYGRLHRKRRAAANARAAVLVAQAEAEAQAARREPLMLPAPAPLPLFPGLNAIPTRRIPVAVPADQSSES